MVRDRSIDQKASNVIRVKVDAHARPHAKVQQWNARLCWFNEPTARVERRVAMWPSISLVPTGDHGSGRVAYAGRYALPHHMSTPSGLLNWAPERPRYPTPRSKARCSDRFQYCIMMAGCCASRSRFGSWSGCHGYFITGKIAYVSSNCTMTRSNSMLTTPRLITLESTHYIGDVDSESNVTHCGQT